MKQEKIQEESRPPIILSKNKDLTDGSLEKITFSNIITKNPNNLLSHSSLPLNIQNSTKDKNIITINIHRNKLKIFLLLIIILLFLLFILSSTIFYKLGYKLNENHNNRLKVGICVMARLQNKYIKEFVDYYKDLEVDTIFIYDNNDKDGEKFERVIKPEIDSGFVKIYNYREKIGLQTFAYRDCYKRNEKKYDWLFIIDSDEYFTIVGNRSLRQFLNDKIYKNCNSIKINWMEYGDNGLLYYENKSLQERFTQPMMPLNRSGIEPTGIPNNYWCKSIIRGKIKAKLYNFNPHFAPGLTNACNVNGDKVENDRSIIDGYYFDKAYFKHYSAKTAEEFIWKVKRGRADIAYDYEFKENKIREVKYSFFGRNDITNEKIDILENGLDLDLSDLRNETID